MEVRLDVRLELRLEVRLEVCLEVRSEVLCGEERSKGTVRRCGHDGQQYSGNEAGSKSR